MKTNPHSFSKLLTLLLAAFPAISSAAVPSTSPYVTDPTSSYVQDETTQAMQRLNGILCHVGAMDPAEMVNLGPYIALVDQNVCNPNDSGGQTTNTGANYAPALVNVTRTDNNSPMIGRVWIDEPRNNSSIFAYLSATQAPTPPADPYGRFRLDYAQRDSTAGTLNGQGFIESTASGLSFYQSDTGNWGMGGASVTDTLQLILNATSSSAGSGALSEAYTGPGASGMPTPPSFVFAYDANYFRRSDGTNDFCFDRNPANATTSVWNYGVYDSTTGARIERNSGFPIEYTDAASGATMNGYIGYWGLWTPTTVANGAAVNQVTYSNNGATKTPYTLLQTGGKLVKYTRLTQALSQLDKVRFQFWAQATVGPVTAGTGYEIYWDQTGGTFWVTGQQDPTTYNIVPITPVALSVANMQTAAPWGIYGWSQMMGGSFTIDSAAMATLSGSTNVVTYTQDVVYPSDFAALGGLLCLSNCPTAADITASNADLTGATQPYASTTTSWASYSAPGVTPYSYTLSSTTGNLVDAAAAAVVNTATTGVNAGGVMSGRLVAVANQAQLDAAVTARSGTAGQYTQGDIDTLTTYYQWQTGANNWNQLSILKDAGGNPVHFDPPLNVSFTVPAGAQYGTAAGANITLQYGGFGNLWGIPSTCVNAATNQPCTFTAGENQRWTPEFSIPDGSTLSVSTTQGTVTAGTTYLVKGLQKEVRLAKVSTTTCATAGLTLPAPGSVTLPTNASWQDPSSASSATYVGTKPTFTTVPAPRVIQGVKMY